MLLINVSGCTQDAYSRIKLNGTKTVYVGFTKGYKIAKWFQAVSFGKIKLCGSYTIQCSSTVIELAVELGFLVLRDALEVRFLCVLMVSSNIN